jgi:transcriptional regulator with XRE-family HTH domain
MAPKEDFAQRLKRLIDERGMSQTVLAAKTRIERSELNRLVNGKRDPKPYEIGWLAEALGVSPKELIAGIDYEKLELFEEEVERGQTHAREVLTAERERDDAKAMYKALDDQVHEMEERWRTERRELQTALAEQRDDCKQRVALREEALAKREQELLDQNAVLRDRITVLERELRQAQVVTADRGRQVEQLQKAVEDARGKAAGAAIFAGLIGAAIGSSGKS